MANLIAVLAIMLLMLSIQLPLLVKEKQWGELAAFSALWLIASLYASLVALDIPLPQTTQFIISRMNNQ